MTALGSGCRMGSSWRRRFCSTCISPLLLLAYVAFLCLYRHSPNGPRTVRHCVGSGGLCCGAVWGRGLRPSASDRLDRTDWPPDDRRCGGSTIFRKKSAVHDRVGAGRSGGYCLVALHVRATGAGRSTANDAGDRMACDTDRGDPHLVGVWFNPIYTPRYLCFTAPAVALVLGVCIGALAVTAMDGGGHS